MVEAEEPKSSGTRLAPYIQKMFWSMKKKIPISQFQVLNHLPLWHFPSIVENSLSGDFIMINIRSLFKPMTNEVWIKNAKTDVVTEKFWLI